MIRLSIAALTLLLTPFSLYAIHPVALQAGPGGSTSCQATSYPHTCQQPQRPSYCRPCAPLLGAEVGSNALYWRSANEGVQYCTINNNPEPSLPRYVLPRSRFGYDIWGQATLFTHCFTIAGRYVSFNSHSGDATSGPTLVPVFAPLFGLPVTFASGQIREKYRSADLEARWSLSPCCWLSGALIGGVRYFDLAQNEEYLYLQAATFVPGKQLLRYDGWGPRLGLRFSFDPFKNRCCPWNIALKGQVATTAAIGTRRLTLDTTSSGNFPQGTLLFPNRRTLTPALDWQLELNGRFCICGLFVSVRIGYEQNYYFSAFLRVETTNTLGIVPRSEKLAGFGGPFAGLSVGF